MQSCWGLGLQPMDLGDTIPPITYIIVFHILDLWLKNNLDVWVCFCKQISSTYLCSGGVSTYWWSFYDTIFCSWARHLDSRQAGLESFPEEGSVRGIVLSSAISAVRWNVPWRLKHCVVLCSPSDTGRLIPWCFDISCLRRNGILVAEEANCHLPCC